MVGVVTATRDRDLTLLWRSARWPGAILYSVTVRTPSMPGCSVHTKV